jgi:hypothetical protein
MPVMTNSQPVVGGNGDIYTAPVGTPIPTDIEAPAAPWVKLGMVSEDGVSWTPPEEDTDEIKIWQSAYPARVITTGLTSSMSFALDGWDRNTVPFAMGGGTFTDVGTDTVVFSPPQAGASTSRAIFVKVLDGDPAAGGIVMGLYFAKGRVTGRDDTVFNASEPALLNVEFSLEALVNPDGTVEDPYNLVFDDASFPPVAVAATGATAGTPGSFTPAGATPPANLAAMSTVVASPLTAWTTGQYVTRADTGAADTGKCHWSSTAWVSGVA